MRRTFLLSLLRSLVGWKRKVPEIARGLPSSYAEGELVFDERVKIRFPPWSEEGLLLEEVRRQGFTIVEGREGPFATFSDGAFPVQTVWHIGWTAKDGRIGTVWGVYGGVGP